MYCPNGLEIHSRKPVGFKIELFMKLLALPAFSDNYFWLWHNGQDAVVVDPGDSKPVAEALTRLGLKLKHIVVTHHHPDHVGGIEALVNETQALVHGPEHPSVPKPCDTVQGGDELHVLGQTLRVLAVPGHTKSHLAYFAPSSPEQTEPVLFCGDTLFSAGCGRLFEGSPQEMLASLKTLAQLPSNTLVCCAHEYTLSNLKFARHVEPGNGASERYLAQCQALRAQSLPTLPSTVGLELAINPFLRTQEPEVVASVMARVPGGNSPGASSDVGEVEVFAALREWKNTF
jgi:hydroxyacylglutathione hydrolase